MYRIKARKERNSKEDYLKRLLMEKASQAACNLDEHQRLHAAFFMLLVDETG
ncbi:hypothetical protein SD77_2313 [Bacillus badius]|uniref:Uncharacterized protein n=1 Tax=Bacillus badius TaxID=1455 RepID=A0ABR5AYP9_BACBA|nr:hypothetical protein SD78_2223 [Bacillus badius]KIL79859.1 hypothetical protein SD77_2313 [Bacillus badius]